MAMVIVTSPIMMRFFFFMFGIVLMPIFFMRVAFIFRPVMVIILVMAK